MPIAPPQPAKGPLTVYRRIWCGQQPITFADDGARHAVATLDEARAYAASHGYRGIRVCYERSTA